MKYILFLLFPAIIYCQFNPNTLLPNISPVNPQAYQFIKYGEIPVSKYTGVPEISIPIYTLETKGINIPIVLNYHSSGIKVNEEASWVGLGWNLNTDMQIVQQVVGLDDYGRYKNRKLVDFNCMLPIQAGLSASGVMSGCDIFFLGYDSEWNMQHPDCPVSPLLPAGLRDTEPDIFYFNAAGYSGKFLLDWQTQKFVCLTDKNMRIESDMDGIDTNRPNVFTITTPDGHRFEFTLKDETRINFNETATSEGGSIPSYVESVGQISSRVYKLTNITTNRNEVIGFEYGRVETNIDGTTIELPSKNLPNITIIDKNYIADIGSNTVPNPQGYLTSYNATEQTYYYLKRISYNDESIEFETSSREDLKESKKLDKITVKYKSSIVKTFDFKYDYFIANNLGLNWDDLYLDYKSYAVNKSQAELTKRLKLLSFNGLNEKPYLFEYNSQSLPRKTSYATDYWGYYNGVHQNNSFFINLYSFNLERGNLHYENYQNNNNAPVAKYCQASILEKITYPTGGINTFKYELNTFDNYQVPPFDQGTPKNLHLSTVPGDVNLEEVVLIEGGNTNFKISGLLSTAGCLPYDREAYSRTYLKVTHFKKELLDYIKAHYSDDLIRFGLEYVLGANDLDFLDGNPRDLALYNKFEDDSFYYSKTVNMDYKDEYPEDLFSLEEGIVLFQVSGGCGVYSPTASGNWSQSSFNISYRDYRPLEKGNSFGGGLRISAYMAYSDKISADLGKPAFQKMYEYEGGKIMSPVLHFNKTWMTSLSDVIIGVVDNYACDEQEQSDLVVNAASVLAANANKNTSDNLNIVNTTILSIIQGKCQASPRINREVFVGTKNELSSANFSQHSTSASGNYVGYDKVTEKYACTDSLGIGKEIYEGIEKYACTDSTGIGKEISFYKNTPDLGSIWRPEGDGKYTEINLPLLNTYPENGKLLVNEIYDKNNNLKKQISYSYDFIKERCQWGMKMLLSQSDTQYTPITGFLTREEYLVGLYPIMRGTTVLGVETVKTFEAGKEISSENLYLHDSHNQLASIVSRNSIGDTIIKNFKYPYDFLNQQGYSVYRDMSDENIIAPIVETKTTVNSVPKSLEKKNFIPTSTNINGVSQTTYVPRTIQFAKSGNTSDFEDEITIHSFDNHGNPTEVSKKGGLSTAYIWGYNGKYLIAAIENATADQVANAAVGLQTASDNGTLTEDSFNSLRSNLFNSLITTYTYKPLIGVTSITDPRKNSTYYEYDSSNRLQYIKDKDQNILQRYCYNYLGQQTDCNAGWTGLRTFTNVLTSSTFIKQSCGDGLVGSVCEYSVPAGIYSSTISVLDANNQAEKEIALNGLNFANANGTCLAGLDAPTGLTFTGATSTSLDFSWNAVSGATGYKIYKDGVYVSTITVPDITTATINGLIGTTAYNIQIVASTATGITAPCAPVTMSTIDYTNEGSITNNTGRTINAVAMTITANGNIVYSWYTPSIANGETFRFDTTYNPPINSDGTFVLSVFGTVGITSSNYFFMTGGSTSTNGYFSSQGGGMKATVTSSGPQNAIRITIK